MPIAKGDPPMIKHEKLLQLYREYIEKECKDSHFAAPASFDQWYEKEIKKRGVKFHRVTWTATFETIVAIDNDEQLEDACSDIEIPEDADSQYKSDTFEVEKTEELS